VLFVRCVLLAADTPRQATAQACTWLKHHVGGEHELSDDFWARRPLSSAGKRYAAADALLTRALHDALAPELARIGMLERVQLASDARLREFRDLPYGVPQERTAAHRLAPEL
jgi:ribonuclease D